MAFVIIYLLFIFTYILYGNVVVGGIASPRAIMAFFMFFFCLFDKEKIKFDKYIILFLIFVFFYALSSINTGLFDAFLSRFFRQHFISLICFWSTYIYIKKTNKNVNPLIYIFIGVGLLDAIITIGQFSNASYSTALMDLFGFSIDDEFSDNASASFDMYGEVLPGIFGQVTNGYYLSVTCLFALYNRLGKLKWYNIASWLIIIYALYLCQERTAFFAGVGLSLFVFYKNISDKTNCLFRLLVILSIGLIFVYLYDFFISGETRYALGLDLTNRDFIYRYALLFIRDHLLMGGFHLYIINNPYPHNLVFNALIYGGLFGGIAILLLVTLQTIKVIGYIRLPFKELDMSAFIFGLAFLAFTANSLLHNLSVVSGESIIWVIWSAFFYISNERQISIKI